MRDLRQLGIVLALSFTALQAGAQSFDSATLSGPNFVNEGGSITYSITLTTSGSHPAPTATIIDMLPPATPFIGGSLNCTGGSGTSCSYLPGAHEIQWSGALAVSDSVTISFSVDPSGVAGGTYLVNRAVAEAPSFPAEIMSRTTCTMVDGEEPGSTR